MTAAVILFWISVAILFFTYLGYGAILFFFNKSRALLFPGKKIYEPELLPATIIVTAFNEEEILEKKIRNTLEIDYPAGMLRIIFVTDGSTDDSQRIIQQYPGISLLHEPERLGKYAALKRAMKKVETPIVIFCDANTILNTQCLRNMMKHFADDRVGAVAGEKRIISDSGHSAIGFAEGLYWRYESFLKKMDAELSTVIGAAGELFAIRRHLFVPKSDDIILDDFITSMEVCLQGKKIAYEPGAFASEYPSLSLAEEEKRKIRIAAGAYQSLRYLGPCMNLIKYPMLSFQFISRRFLRWTTCPLLIISLFVANTYIILQPAASMFYLVSFLAQCLFYFFAMIGWARSRVGKSAGLFTIPFYFVFMNYCLFKGFFHFLSGKQTALWERSLRQVVQ